MCLKVPTCKKKPCHITFKKKLLLVCVLDMSPKFNCEGKYIAIFRAEKGFPFYVNFTVTQETRLRKRLCTSLAAKRITNVWIFLWIWRTQDIEEAWSHWKRKDKNFLQDLKLPSTRNAICLWVRCCVSTSDVFWYFCCNNICFRIYWLNTIFHFCNEMLFKYPFILYVFDQLEIWEVLKHKGLSRKILIPNNGNLADVVKIPDFLAFIRLCIPSI